MDNIVDHRTDRSIEYRKVSCLAKLNKIFWEYLDNSSFHGIKFIVDKKSRLSERLFWIICVILSWIGSALLIESALDAFFYNAISFVAETSYNHWDTNFPATVICETKNLDRVEQISEELWGDEHEFTLEEVLNEISYFRGESYHTIHNCDETETTGSSCISSNFSFYARLVRSPCRKTLNYCHWNNVEFDCCTYFQMLETEFGICYSLNSKQSHNQNGPKLNMISNRITGPGKLSFEVLTDANVYTLGEEEVPNLVTSKSDVLIVGPYISYSRFVSIRNIENDPEIRSTSIEQRNCRFSDENYLDVYNHYSYSACSVQCRKDNQMKRCNCTSHLMPNAKDWEQCNITGLKCLNDNYEDLSVVRAEWATAKKGVVCNCLPSCTEIDISFVQNTRTNIYGHQRPISVVEISLIGLPTERYKRNVIRGKLDLVVSIGGTAGLFLGGSLLSFAEIIYYFLVRLLSVFLLRRERVHGT